MENINLENALTDLCDAIRGATLGSVEHVVMEAAGRELIINWNDHNSVDSIDAPKELENWAELCKNDYVIIRAVKPGCPCGEDH